MSLNDVDYTFHSLYAELLAHGHIKGDRTAVGTKMLPAQMMRFDVTNGKMPYLSTRKIPDENPRLEMHMFVTGTTSIKMLRDRNVGIWDGWSIKGTEVYDQPREPMDFRKRLLLVSQIGKVPALAERIREIQSHSELGAARKLIETFPLVRQDGIIEFFGLTKEEYDLVDIWLHQNGVGWYRVPGGKPISIQRRLARVSKNDTDKWATLVKVVDEPWESLNSNRVGKEILEGGDDVKITIFRDGKFEDVVVRPIVVAALEVTLDKLDISKYELLDADIGQGSYGAQWRTWQDTQLVHEDDVDKFKAQGYEYVTEVDDNDDDRFYGYAVMHREVDQLKNMIAMLKTNPDDRRMIVTAWNPGRTWQAALPPCHLYFQVVTWELDINELERLVSGRGLFDEFLTKWQETNTSAMAKDEDQYPMLRAFVEEKGLPTRGITMFVLLRSSDAPLGAVFNVAQYAYLLHAIGQIVNMEPMELVTVGVDVHIYSNQVEGVEELLERDSPADSSPHIVFKRQITNIDDFKLEDAEIVDYNPLPFIKIPVAI